MFEDNTKNDNDEEEHIAQSDIAESEIGYAISRIMRIVRYQPSTLECCRRRNIDENTYNGDDALFLFNSEARVPTFVSI